MNTIAGVLIVVQQGVRDVHAGCARAMLMSNVYVRSLLGVMAAIIAALKNFVRQPKETFSTKSAKS